MRILILGNSNIFQRKIFPALLKIRNLKIELASKSFKATNIKYEKVYKNYENALNKTTANLVYISLVNSLHYKWALKSLAYNKNLIIDKPIALNLNQTKKIIKLASKKKLLVTEAIVFDLHKQFKKMHSLLDFKKKTKIQTEFHIPKLNKNNFRNFNKFGGGCFQDMSPYASSMIKTFFKNQKYLIKVKKKKNSNGIIEHFKVEVESKNISLKSSFSFNSVYKNQMHIYNNHKHYFINRPFSPPIDKKLELNIFNDTNKKNHKIRFSQQNVFLTYINFVINILRKKKYNFFYKEIIDIAKIKKKIS